MQTSLIKKSDVNRAGRFDAEYFMPEYLEIERKLEKIKTSEVKDIFYPVKNGVDFRDFTKKGNIFYIRTADIKENGFQETAVKIEFSNIPKKVKLKYNDILFTRKGNYGKNCIVDETIINSLISSEIMLLRKKENGFSIFYLSIFLRSFFGKNQIERNVHGVSNFSITQPALEKIKIPILPQSFQLKIESIVKDAHQKQAQSKQLYKKAEQILLAELGLIDHKIKDYLTFKTTKKEVDKVGRFDAEYFQPKYKAIIKKIENYKGGFKEIKELAQIENGSFISEKKYVQNSKRAYIRIKELSLNNLLDKENMIFISDDFKRSNETDLKENDFVIATIGATIGKINLILKEFEMSFPSNNTSRIRLNNENSFYYYFELLFRSFLFQKQIEKEFTQTAQPKISNSQIEKIKIPLIAKKIQAKIASLVEKSHILRKESKDLLEKAKKKVEEKIEKQ